MAMLRSLAEPSERMVARPATADIYLGIAAEAARRLCGLWLAVVGGTRRRFLVQALSQSVPNRGMFPMFPRPKKVFPVPEVFPSDGVFPCSLFPIGTQSMPVPNGKMRVPNG